MKPQQNNIVADIKTPIPYLRIGDIILFFSIGKLILRRQLGRLLHNFI